MSAVDFERRLEGGRGVEIWVMELWGVFHSSLLHPWCMIGPLYNRLRRGWHGKCVYISHNSTLV